MASIIYGTMSIAALFMTAAFYFIEQKKISCLLPVALSVFISNFGWFLTSVSQTLKGALRANRIAYLGNVFLPLFMLSLILNVCQISISKKFLMAALVFSAAILLLTFTPGYSNVYYASVALIQVDGFSVLDREYGPLHIIFYLYLFAYFMSMLTVIGYTFLKKKFVNRMHVLYLFFIVSGNLLIWIMEQFTEKEWEFLSIAYLVSEVLIYLHIGALNTSRKEGENNILKKSSEPLFKGIQGEEKTVFSEESIDNIFSRCEALKDFTDREKEVLRLILMNKKRKEIGQELFLAESTIKKYTAQIFRKLSVNNRMELFLLLKMYQ